MVGVLVVTLAGLGLGAPVAPAAAEVTDPNPEFRVNTADLKFILNQIRISEAHAMGGELVCADPADTSWTCVPDRRLPFGLRTVDGRDNNLFPGRRDYGAAATDFKRRIPAQFRDADPSLDLDGPGPMPGGLPTTYAQKSGIVVDAEPRRVSNLIVDQTTDNPAAVAAAGEVPGSSTDADGNVFIPNESPDEGLSAPFNSWFTLFGQFFDHGLDLVAKSGSGAVFVPVEPGDDLYVPGGHANFIPLTRATNRPGPDGVLGTEDDVQEHRNLTTPFVDQNQTYTSQPSHQVFLREYRLEDGVPVPTGHLLDGADGGLPTWTEIKAQARDLLGIQLQDSDVLNVPMVVTDPYGHFVPGENGLPRLVVPGEGAGEDPQMVEGSLETPVDASEAIRVNVAFLDDIAHGASPAEEGYDAALLGSHFITGDGRGNENIGLTSVHHVFHSEHNRVVAQIDELINEQDEEFQADWRDESGAWDYGERLFQAGRFVTEMEYQHLVFEEFGRTVAPSIDVGPVNETLYHADVDSRITAEFAHVVYRFGHSMLTDTVAREGHGTEDLSLFDAFLNPAAFTDGGTITPDQGAGAVINGMVNQVGNGIDEFVVDTLRNQLLGVSLDLAAINITRARETGVPPLQEARRVLYRESLNPAVKPYEDWEDFRLALKNRASIENFIAAYGDHATLESATTDDERRAAARVLMEDQAFMHGAPATTGLDDVDFWMGGLAERAQVFGGMLGTTFNLVFEEQLEDLQNGDRFYYLTRLQGLNLLSQLEANSFAEMIQRNTEVGPMPANAFATQSPVIELGDLPADQADWPAGLTYDSGTGTYRYDGGEHVTMHGTVADDRMRGGDGDDALWGHEDADRIEGDIGNDTLHGGPGDDVLTDLFGDDVIHGGGGHDAINAGPGLDLVFGQSGTDFVMHGEEPTQSFAGAGTDFIRGGRANDILTGNEADDWLEGNLGHDLVQGDNALTFQNDPVGGADVLIGGSGNDDHDAEGGNDVMLNNGIDRHAGMLGFDWVTHKLDPDPVEADLALTIFQPPNVQLMRSRYMNVEGISGWNGPDVIRGRDVAGDPTTAAGDGHELTQEHIDEVDGLRELLGGGDNPPYAEPFMTPSGETESDAPDIVLGGAGSDLLEGRAGDDFIDGDAWLDTYLVGPDGETADSMTAFMGRIFDGDLSPADLDLVREIKVPTGQAEVVDTAVFSGDGDDYEVTENDDGTVTVDGPDGVDTLSNVERLLFDDGERDLTAMVQRPAEGTVTIDVTDPAEDQVLTVTADPADANGIDPDAPLTFTWQSQDDAGNWAATPEGVGESFTPGDAEVGRALRVVVTFQDDLGATEMLVSEATDPVTNVNDEPVGPLVDETAPTIGTTLAATGLEDADGLPEEVSYQWQRSTAGGFTTVGNGAEYTVQQADGGRTLRVVASYTDAHGTEEAATSEATSEVPAWTVPGASAIQSVTPGIGSLSVIWAGPGDTDNAPVTSYDLELRRGGDVIGTYTQSAEEAQATIDGLADGNYRVRVAAVNLIGRGAWSPLSDVVAVAPVDLVAPTVAGRNPDAGQAGVAPGANVVVTFSEDVSGVDDSTLALSEVGGGDPVAATVTMTSPRRAVLDPSDALGSDTEYEVSLAEGVVDGQGNPLAPVSWRFATRDSQRPSVVERVPADEATGISQNPVVTATFDEPVEGVDGSTMRLLQAGTALPATVTYDAASRTATLDPVGLLPAGTRLTVRLTTGITDQSGNTLPTTAWQFRTGNDAAPAVLARTTGVVARGAVLRMTLSEPVVSVAARHVTVKSKGKKVPAKVRWVKRKRLVKVVPKRTLPARATVRVKVRGVRDRDGNTIRRTQWRLTTRRR